MKQRTLIFWMSMVVALIVSGALQSRDSDAASKARGTKCYILYENKDCFTNLDFTMKNLTLWSRSYLTLDLDRNILQKKGELASSPSTCGNWATWKKSSTNPFFMIDVTNCSGTVIKGHPFYAGIAAANSGQGLMSPDNVGDADPGCWYMKSVSKQLTSFCPTISGATLVETEEEDEDDNSLDDLEEIETYFIHLKEEWLKSHPR